MKNRITNSTGLAAYCKAAKVKVVAFDLRGTLLDAARMGNLELVALNWGMPPAIAQDMNQQIPESVRLKYAAESKVLDWTLVTLAELWWHCHDLGYEIDSCAFEAAVHDVRNSYVQDAIPLVQDSQLVLLFEALRALRFSVVIVTDGDHSLQSRVIRQKFPRSSSFINRVFSSSQLGVNKYGSLYYQKVCEILGIETRELLVIGDRMDKDITPAQSAGCPTLLTSIEADCIDSSICPIWELVLD
jgi:HAD superfamily hydrolase (TIGR01549 family)